MTLKHALTDDQLGQFYRRIIAIVDRMGKSLPFDQVMQALQSIHDGQAPVIPTLIVESKFTSWRAFMIGGVDKKALLKRIEARFSVAEWVRELMLRSAFTTQGVEEQIDTIILTPADFGYERKPTTTELFNPARLSEWNAQNAERLDGRVVELLPAEAGPHIRDQYKDQPKGEVLWITIERITGFDERPDIFCVQHTDDGVQSLSAHHAGRGGYWELDDRIVFRLRKVTQD